MRWIVRLCAFVVLISTLAACSGASSTPKANTSNTVKVTDSSPPHEKLAAIQAGNHNPSTSLVQSFQSAMTNLEQKCPKDSEENLSDYTVTAQSLLKSRGHQMDLLEIMQRVNDSIPAGGYPGRCSDVFAAFTSLVAP